MRTPPPPPSRRSTRHRFPPSVRPSTAPFFPMFLMPPRAARRGGGAIHNGHVSFAAAAERGRRDGCGGCENNAHAEETADANLTPRGRKKWHWRGGGGRRPFASAKFRHLSLLPFFFFFFGHFHAESLGGDEFSTFPLRSSFRQ